MWENGLVPIARVTAIFHATQEAAMLDARNRRMEYALGALSGGAKGTFDCDFPAGLSPE
jgi:hypothetical protein